MNLQGNSFGKGYVSGTLYSLHSQSKLNYKGNPFEKATFPGRYIHEKRKQVKLQGKSFGKGYVSGTLYSLTINFASVQGSTYLDD